MKNQTLLVSVIFLLAMTAAAFAEEKTKTTAGSAAAPAAAPAAASVAAQATAPSAEAAASPTKESGPVYVPIVSTPIGASPSKNVPIKSTPTGVTAVPMEASVYVSSDTSVPAVPITAEVSQGGNVSLDFKDADIKNVLKILAFKSGVNIVPAPDVTGVVSIQLNDVPWEQALDVILRTYGYAYEKKGNIILVMTVDGMKKRREDSIALAEQETFITKTFSLNYAKAADVLTSILKMKSEKGSAEVDERTNTLIVTDTASRIELIESVIKKLDRTTPQVLIEGKVVETDVNNGDDLGIKWNPQVSISGPKRPYLFPFKQISKAPSKNDATTSTVNSDGTVTTVHFPDQFPAAPTSAFGYGTLDFTSFSATMKYLESRSSTNILSSPSITTLDNQTAKIDVGLKYPLPTFSFSQQTNTIQLSGYNYQDIGVSFIVTPHVNSAEMVTLEVEPKIQSRGDNVAMEGVNIPIINNQSAKTTVLIRSGDTLVIGGLITKQKNDTRTNVPFLSRIPLLGYFFKNKSATETKTDLIIFITPHIVTPESPSTVVATTGKS
ncbi:MAG: type IV pilus secretin PilQ [Candidatus Omnitrophica bacterium]|nr:type IV pilus secretin PilQ [Candidatus Omnitrophota bacterium]